MPSLSASDGDDEEFKATDVSKLIKESTKDIQDYQDSPVDKRTKQINDKASRSESKRRVSGGREHADNMNKFG